MPSGLARRMVVDTRVETPSRSESTPSTALDGMDGEEGEAHVAECLRKVAVGRGVGMVIREQIYCTNPSETIEGRECRIARLNCLCIYHEPCIEAWFKKSGTCPVHYK
ncbi:hypothetical protein BC829DRAFT_391140 [Chytridium lagenaria]|nr:hypothetical protein BC829DRAFT_391140 [Chytridium lagenaria]